MRLVQIVPRLRPFDGVADYAQLLSRSLQQAHRAETVFVSAEPVGDFAPAFPARSLAGRTSDALVEALEAARDGQPGAVLLHYVGYGYSRRGAPRWLMEALRQARRSSAFRLVVVFHELYASGPPWTSAFWLQAFQKGIARRIAEQCDAALFTREANRRWLADDGTLTGKDVGVLPVCSNVGEPRDLRAASARPPVMAVWGSSAAKQVLYGRCWRTLEQVCQTQGITKILDLGPQAPRYPAHGVPIEVLGLLPAGEISRRLQEARFGILRYPVSFLSKSSVLAGYAAHGVVPLPDEERTSLSLDGLEAGRHFLPLAEAATRPLLPVELDAFSGDVQVWYAQHSSARHGEMVRRLMEERGT